LVLWADIDNAPHVLVLAPIISWLSRHGHRIEITARDYGQTLPLLELLGLQYTVTGKHAGKRRNRKVISFITRSMQLERYAARRSFAAVFSHGTRAVYIPARLHGIPLVMLMDYEHGALPRLFFRWPDLFFVPHVMPEETFLRRGVRPEALQKYQGLKEELYVYDLEPDASPLQRLGLNLEQPIVLVRPPASMAHYHIESGDELFVAVLDRLHAKRDVQVIVLPRTREQSESIRVLLNERGWSRIHIPSEVTYGPNLIYYSDLVISGGGTMNREAACMGVPVYTIFKGPMGSVDRHLIADERLRMMDSAGQLDSMRIEKMPRPDLAAKRHVRESIVRTIGEAILSRARPGPAGKGAGK
jgi:predicted glycosyltransferase